MITHKLYIKSLKPSSNHRLKIARDSNFLMPQIFVKSTLA